MLVKTISTKTVFGDKERILETVMSDKTKEHFLYRVIGVIEAQETGLSRYKRIDKETGEAKDQYWHKFFGEFVAINNNGEQYEGATCFLPDYVTGKFSFGLENGETDMPVAFDVYAIYSKERATSYEFVATPVRREGEESKLKALANQFAALPGQAKQAQIEHKGKKKE